MNASEPPHLVRRSIAVLLVFVVALLVPAVALGRSMERAVVDPEGATALANEVLSRPAVIDGMATWLTDEVFDSLAPAVLDNVPRWLRPFVRSAGEAAHEQLHQTFVDVLSSDAGQQVMVDAVLVARSSALRVLAGNGLFPNGTATIGDGAVTVNLVPVAALALRSLSSDGTVPGGDVIQTSLQLAALVGVELPDDFGQLTVYRNDAIGPSRALRSARGLLVALERAQWWLLLTLVVVAVALLALAVDRRVAVARAGFGVSIVSGAAILWIGAAGDGVGEAISSPGGRVAATSLALALVHRAEHTLWLVGGVSMAVAVVCTVWWFLARPAER